jgi:hypothetical protein
MKQLRRAAVGVATVAVLGSLASAALADDVAPANQQYNPLDLAANDPNTTNVPYLAWRGENLRMVKCYGTNDFQRIYRQRFPSQGRDIQDSDLPAILASILTSDTQIEDWSGYDTGINTPKEVTGGARTFLWYNVRTMAPVICFQDTWASQKAGLGQFKLTVSANLDFLFGTTPPVGADVLVMQHQWLAGWMSLTTPTLDEVSSIDPAKDPEGLGDPKGDGTFFAGDNWTIDPKTGKYVFDKSNAHPGEVRVTVKGLLPLGQDYSELGIPTDSAGNITLPDDWSKLANALATDEDPTNTNPAMRWDIHDELVDEHGNTMTGSGGRSMNATDPVVNVKGDPRASQNDPTSNSVNWWGDASFSRLLTRTYGSTPATMPASDAPTAGPFDPNFAEETLLPDGKLDAGDAPMPAARIDFAIAPTVGSSPDGVGSFVSASKAHDYSMDYTGSNAHSGNLFAPFYSQYIPATSRDTFGYASGVDGAYITNNFNGFLQWGQTPDWAAYSLSDKWAAPTKCVRAYNQVRKGPSGSQTAAVYTDEHGEARIGYLPGGYGGDGFNFDALKIPGHDSNGGCDLAGVQVLGTSQISAIARYPYQKVTDPDKPAKTGPLTKTVYSLFQKNLSYYVKNDDPNSAGSQLDKIIVAHGQDIDGQPFAGETVCFSADYENVGGSAHLIYVDHTNVVVNRPSSPLTVTEIPTSAPSNMPQGFLCAKLDSNGNAVIEVQGSVKDDVDILANFTDENLSRDIVVTRGGATFSDNPPLTPDAILAGTGAATTGAGSNGDNTAATAGSDTPTPALITKVVTGSIASGNGVAPTATPQISAAPAIAASITPVIVKAKTIKTRVLTLSVVHPAHAKAYVSVKVQSASTKAKIVIALKNIHGKTIAKLSKTISANKLVKIQSSLITIAVKKIGLTSVK